MIACSLAAIRLLTRFSILRTRHGFLTVMGLGQTHHFLDADLSFNPPLHGLPHPRSDGTVIQFDGVNGLLRSVPAPRHVVIDFPLSPISSPLQPGITICITTSHPQGFSISLKSPNAVLIYRVRWILRLRIYAIFQLLLFIDALLTR